MENSEQRPAQDSGGRVLHSMRQAGELLGLSRTVLYRLIEDGRLDARKIDGKIVIPDASLRAFIDALPRPEHARRRWRPWHDAPAAPAAPQPPAAPAQVAPAQPAAPQPQQRPEGARRRWRPGQE